MYRPPATAPRGRWAQFLHQMRRERDWNQTQAFEALGPGLGLGLKSRASYLALDAGSRSPRPQEAEFLVKFFGREPDDMPPAEPAPDPIMAALAEQTAAIKTLVAAMDADREERRALVRALSALAKSLSTPQAAEVLQELHVRQETVG
jgi:hypothetical protein